MQAFNYCRQMVQQFRTESGSADKDLAIALSAESEKFFLDIDDARELHDPEHRGLREGEALRLPFPAIAIEIHNRPENGSTKQIIFAREIEGRIELVPVAYFHGSGWATFGKAEINPKNYLDRTSGEILAKQSKPCDEATLIATAEAARATLFLLNALTCSNVQIGNLPARKERKKARSALPFDAYRILVISKPKSRDLPSAQHGDTSRRSPREHQRRGSYHTLPSGRRYFYSATIVNPGGGGRIDKQYRLSGIRVERRP